MQALSLALLWYSLSDAGIELGSTVVLPVWCRHWAWLYCCTSCLIEALNFALLCTSGLMQALSLALLLHFLSGWSLEFCSIMYFLSDESIELGSTVVLHVWCKHWVWLYSRTSCAIQALSLALQTVELPVWCRHWAWLCWRNFLRGKYWARSNWGTSSQFKHWACPLCRYILPALIQQCKSKARPDWCLVAYRKFLFSCSFWATSEVLHVLYTVLVFISTVNWDEKNREHSQCLLFAQYWGLGAKEQSPKSNLNV